MEANWAQADADKDLSIKTGYMVERVGTPFLFGPTFHFQSAPETAEKDAPGWLCMAMVVAQMGNEMETRVPLRMDEVKSRSTASERGMNWVVVAVIETGQTNWRGL